MECHNYFYEPHKSNSLYARDADFGAVEACILQN